MDEVRKLIEEAVEKIGEDGRLKSATVHSFSEPDTTYEISADFLTCTCADFTDRRAQFPPSDPRRLCKHLASRCGTKTGITNFAPYDALIRFARERAWGVPIFAKEERRDIGGRNCIALLPDVTAHEAGHIWINVLVDGKCHGYSPEQKRWAFGNEPAGAHKLVPWLSGLVDLSKAKDGTKYFTFGVEENQDVRFTPIPSGRHPAGGRSPARQFVMWAGISVGLIAAAVVIVMLLVSFLHTSTAPVALDSTTKSLVDLEILAQMKILRSLDEKAHVAYVDAAWWKRYDEKTRREAALWLAEYCDKKARDGIWIKIVDKYSGRRLAQYSAEVGYVPWAAE